MEFGIPLKLSKNYFSLPDQELADNVIPIFDFYERARKR